MKNFAWGKQAQLQSSARLPAEITSYDILKAVAVLLMVIDHVGYYFFPDENLFRIIGRFCVPMWMFLIGYARSRDITPLLIICAISLIAFDMITGRIVFPLNILVSIIFVRLTIDMYMKFTERNEYAFWGMAFILFILGFPTFFFWEYGFFALSIAIFGYLVRRRQDNGGIEKFHNQSFKYMIFMIFTFPLYMQVFFGFSTAEFSMLLLGQMAVFYLLFSFKPMTFEKETQRLPAAGVDIIKILGRQTLIIYTVHLIIFKLAGLAFGLENYGLFQFYWLAYPGEFESIGLSG